VSSAGSISPTAATSSLQAGSKVRSSRRKGAIRLSISSAFTRASRSPFGGPKGGFISTILVVGFNGTAAISGAAGWRTMRARSGAGRQCVATFAKSSAPARKATCSAAHANARRSCTGLMIAAPSESGRVSFSRAASRLRLRQQAGSRCQLRRCSRSAPAMRAALGHFAERAAPISR
jgi:hypothetical protein